MPCLGCTGSGTRNRRPGTGRTVVTTFPDHRHREGPMATSLFRWAQAATPASLLALGVPGPPAAAAILTVTDYGVSGAGTQLRALLAGAAAGDTIVLPACTVTLQAG